MSCIGVGGCQPTAAELTTLQACHPAGAAFGLPAGTELITNKCDANAPVTGGTCANGLQPGTVETVICCTIPGSVRPLPKVNAQDVNLGTIETLVKYTRSVNYNGEIVNIVIATW